ncbi:hypothetical protein Tco_1281919 [Tanacetum coccineum]
MNRSLFTRIVRDLSANCPYFQEGCDTVGKAGISALVKIRKEKGKAISPDFYPEEQHREDDPGTISLTMHLGYYKEYQKKLPGIAGQHNATKPLEAMNDKVHTCSIPSQRTPGVNEKQQQSGCSSHENIYSQDGKSVDTQDI